MVMGRSERDDNYGDDYAIDTQGNEKVNSPDSNPRKTNNEKRRLKMVMLNENSDNCDYRSKRQAR